MRDIERYEADYIAGYGFERYMVRYRRKQVLSCLARYPHQRILEVGCGLEPLFEHIDDWHSYTIVEPGREFVERAKARVPQGRVVDVRQDFIEHASHALQGRGFDFIIVSSLLHEVGDPSALLAAVRSLCDDRTVVHVNVPNARSLHNRLAVSMGLMPDVFSRSALAERMQRTSTYDLEALSSLVRSAGFTVDSSGSYFLKPFTHAQLQQMLDQEIIDDRVLDALYDVNAEFIELGAELYVNMSRA